MYIKYNQIYIQLNRLDVKSKLVFLNININLRCNPPYLLGYIKKNIIILINSIQLANSHSTHDFTFLSPFQLHLIPNPRVKNIKSCTEL